MQYEFKRKINYYETDKMGVVHHSNYIRFLEEARCQWLDDADIPMTLFEREGVTIPVLGVEVEYKNHITYADTLIIRLKITEFNGVRMTVEYETENAADGKQVIIARTKHCFTNIALRPVNLKKHSREIYDKLYALADNEADNPK